MMEASLQRHTQWPLRRTLNGMTGVVVMAFISGDCSSILSGTDQKGFESL